MQFVPTDLQVADALTKGLSVAKFEPFRDKMLGLLPNPSMKCSPTGAPKEVKKVSWDPHLKSVKSEK